MESLLTEKRLSEGLSPDNVFIFEQLPGVSSANV